MESVFVTFVKKVWEKYRGVVRIYYDDFHKTILIIPKDTITYRKLKNLVINMFEAERYAEA